MIDSPPRKTLLCITAHDCPVRGLVEGLDTEDFLRRSESRVELRGANSDRQELRHRAVRKMSQALALGENPAVEILLAQIKAQQEFPVVKALDGLETLLSGPPACQLTEPQRINVGRLARTPEKLRIDADELLAESMSNVRNGLAQAVTRVCLLLISPQQTRDGLACHALVRAHSQVSGKGRGFASWRSKFAAAVIFEAK